MGEGGVEGAGKGGIRVVDVGCVGEEVCQEEGC